MSSAGASADITLLMQLGLFLLLLGSLSGPRVFDASLQLSLSEIL